MAAITAGRPAEMLQLLLLLLAAVSSCNTGAEAAQCGPQPTTVFVQKGETRMVSFWHQPDQAPAMEGAELGSGDQPDLAGVEQEISKAAAEGQLLEEVEEEQKAGGDVPVPTAAAVEATPLIVTPGDPEAETPSPLYDQQPHIILPEAPLLPGDGGGIDALAADAVTEPGWEIPVKLDEEKGGEGVHVPQSSGETMTTDGSKPSVSQDERDDTDTISTLQTTASDNADKFDKKEGSGLTLSDGDELFIIPSNDGDFFTPSSETSSFAIEGSGDLEIDPIMDNIERSDIIASNDGDSNTPISESTSFTIEGSGDLVMDPTSDTVEGSGVAPPAMPDLLSQEAAAVPDLPSKGAIAVPDLPSEGAAAVPDLPSKGAAAVPDLPSKGAAAVHDLPSEGAAAVPDLPSEGAAAVPDLPLEGAAAAPAHPSEGALSAVVDRIQTLVISDHQEADGLESDELLPLVQTHSSIQQLLSTLQTSDADGDSGDGDLELSASEPVAVVAVAPAPPAQEKETETELERLLVVKGLDEDRVILENVPDPEEVGSGTGPELEAEEALTGSVGLSSSWQAASEGGEAATDGTMADDTIVDGSGMSTSEEDEEERQEMESEIIKAIVDAVSTVTDNHGLDDGREDVKSGLENDGKPVYPPSAYRYIQTHNSPNYAVPPVQPVWTAFSRYGASSYLPDASASPLRPYSSPPSQPLRPYSSPPSQPLRPYSSPPSQPLRPYSRPPFQSPRPYSRPPSQSTRPYSRPPSQSPRPYPVWEPQVFEEPPALGAGPFLRAGLQSTSPAAGHVYFPGQFSRGGRPDERRAIFRPPGGSTYSPRGSALDALPRSRPITFDAKKSLRYPDEQLFRFIQSQPYPFVSALTHGRAQQQRVRDARSAPVHCEWQLQTEPHLYLLVTLHNLSAPLTVDCSGAYIEVERENDGFEARWCGDRVRERGSRPHLVFARGEVRIAVHSDEQAGLPTGFDAQVEVIDLLDARQYVTFRRSGLNFRRLIQEPVLPAT